MTPIALSAPMKAGTPLASGLETSRQSGGKVRAPENPAERVRVHSGCVQRRPGAERANRC